MLLTVYDTVLWNMSHLQILLKRTTEQSSLLFSFSCFNKTNSVFYQMCILISEKETQNSNTVYVGYMLKKRTGMQTLCSRCAVVLESFRFSRIELYCGGKLTYTVLECRNSKTAMTYNYPDQINIQTIKCNSNDPLKVANVLQHI